MILCNLSKDPIESAALKLLFGKKVKITKLLKILGRLKPSDWQYLVKSLIPKLEELDLSEIENEEIPPKILVEMGTYNFSLTLPRKLLSLSLLFKHTDGFVIRSLRFPKNSILSEILEGSLTFCGTLKELAFPDSVQKIGDFACGFCKNLETLVLPRHLKSIGDAAFKYCYKLKEVRIPSETLSIGKYAFPLNTKLIIEKLSFHGTNFVVTLDTYDITTLLKGAASLDVRSISFKYDISWQF